MNSFDWRRRVNLSSVPGWEVSTQVSRWWCSSSSEGGGGEKVLPLPCIRGTRKLQVERVVGFILGVGERVAVIKGRTCKSFMVKQ